MLVAHVVSFLCFRSLFVWFYVSAVPARSTLGYRVGNGGVQFLPSHTCPGSAPPRHPPASPGPGPTRSWVRCSPCVPVMLPDAPLAGGRSAGASCVVRQ